ncbi:hypothetical protein K4A83_12425 [Spirulina subsalsa FACHB-351]|uniref:Uncharacterized protein n=1 Tax=Spirulina subsalsa FACHB-351 TaxID=234711 RepID=A0ABT3L6J5_9CYAN|nr:hypothetical protein [Spirulina subsalsa]MCW6037067.1 hypothetical protein [Spirulina subsalsa FACHB-351]
MTQDDSKQAKNLFSSEVQPLSKADTLKALREVIGQLEGLAEKLDTTEQDELAATPALKSLMAGVSALTTSLETPPPPPAAPRPPKGEDDEPLEEIVKNEPSSAVSEGLEETNRPGMVSEPEEFPDDLDDLIEKIPPSFSTVQKVWDWILEKVRFLLPGSWNEKLSDWALTGIISATVVLVLLLSVTWVSRSPAPQVAEKPPTPKLEQPKTSPKSSQNLPSDTEAPSPKAPVAPIAPPSRPLRLNPEQSLIAAIQNQVAEITNQYAEGLIRSIEADFLGSQLIVAVGDEWYSLPQKQQNQLADEMFARSRTLDFKKIELYDGEGVLLARSPVVGDEMVILRRSNE